jgi:hypothetical protein
MVRALNLLVVASVFEILTELFGLAQNLRGRYPCFIDLACLCIDPPTFTLSSKYSHLRQNRHATSGKTKQAVDGKVVLIIFILVG